MGRTRIEGVVRIALAAAVAAGIFGSVEAAAQSPAGPLEPFKLGTFERGGQVFIGVVLRDSQVIDLGQASRALESREAAAKKLSMPGDMNELIARYDTELKNRLSAIVSQVTAAPSAPGYVYALADLKTLPPVRPAVILNAGGNYEEHSQGIAQQTFTLNGQVMQDSNTNRMSHNIYELLHYASNILTLRPGDVISGGSPAGTNIERSEPRWMRAGDTAVCTIEGIGTQTHPVVATVPPSSQSLVRVQPGAPLFESPTDK